MAFSQTNAFITFTNRDGNVVSNAEVLQIFPNKLVWEQNPGTISENPGVVKLSDLPPDLQVRFGYDAQKAAAADEKEKRDLAALRQRIAANAAALSKQQAEAAAALETYNRLANQLEQGRRRIRGQVLERIPEGLLVDSGAAYIADKQKWHYSINAQGNEIGSRDLTVVEGNAPGSEALSLVLLQDYPSANMINAVDIVAYPVGLYTNATSNTIFKTVRKFSCNFDAAIKELAAKEQH